MIGKVGECAAAAARPVFQWLRMIHKAIILKLIQDLDDCQPSNG